MEVCSDVAQPCACIYIPLNCTVKNGKFYHNKKRMLGSDYRGSCVEGNMLCLRKITICKILKNRHEVEGYCHGLDDNDDGLGKDWRCCHGYIWEIFVVRANVYTDYESGERKHAINADA